MIIIVPIKIVKTKHGAAYCAGAMGLTACGSSDENAKMRLKEGIAAWCRSLDKVGQLEDALLRARLHSEPNEDGSKELGILMKEEAS